MPTSDGRLLYEAVERVYLGLDAVQEAATTIREGGAGTLRVGTLPVYAGGLLAEQTGSFLAQHPGIRIELDSADRDDLIAGLLAHRFDLVVSTLPAASQGIEEIKLGEREAVCILHPDNPMARKQKIPLTSISDMPFIGLTAARTQRAASLMVGAGAGISIVDPDICSYIEPGLVEVRPLEPSIKWQFGILVPSRFSLSVAAEQFTTHLKSNIKS